MMRFLFSPWQRYKATRTLNQRPISQALWTQTCRDLAFLPQPQAAASDNAHLRALATLFLAGKQFSAVGIEMTDAMAVSIAAQACLPLLHMNAQRNGTYPELAWYDDFVTIVVHPSAAWATRTQTDTAGVVHQWRELVTGEAMDGGPILLSWPDVADAGHSAARGYNVVIHEFIHKMDMKSGAANGAPPLPGGFGGLNRDQAARHWARVSTESLSGFKEQLSMAQRFGGQQPWLDAYAASGPEEFFAVTAEAYFVKNSDFRQDYAGLASLYDAFFKPNPQLLLAA